MSVDQIEEKESEPTCELCGSTLGVEVMEWGVYCASCIEEAEADPLDEEERDDDEDG